MLARLPRVPGEAVLCIGIRPSGHKDRYVYVADPEGQGTWTFWRVPGGKLGCHFQGYPRTKAPDVRVPTKAVLTLAIAALQTARDETNDLIAWLTDKSGETP